MAQNGEFVRLWAGQVVSAVGGGVSRLAAPLLALALTGSPADAGLLASAQAVPFLFLGLVAGAIIDRADRRLILMACDLARAVAIGSVPVAWWFGSLTVAHLYVVAFVQGTALAFANVAQVAALPRVVAKSQIAAAQSFNQASQGVATLAGPALGAAIIGIAATTEAGASLAYAVDAVTYFASLAALASVRTPLQSARIARATAGRIAQLRADIGAGLRYLWDDRSLRGMAAVNFGQRLLLGGLVLTVIVLAQAELHAETHQVGWLLTAGGAGGLVGATLAARLYARIAIWPLLVAIVTTNAVGYAILATAPVLAVAMVGMAIATFAESLTGIVQVAYRLGTIPDAMQGRVNSTYRWTAFAGVGGGAAAGGYLVVLAGPRLTLALMSVAAALLAIGIASMRRVVAREAARQVATDRFTVTDRTAVIARTG